jgi:DNA mismatch repair protein MLH3
MPSTDSSSQTLVLVDQHAASERVILERLLSDLYAPIDANSTSARLRTNTGCSSTVSTTVLDKPLVFELTANESELLRVQAPLFAQHGILYDLHTTTQSRNHHTLSAKALPPGIAERCKLFPKLLIDLLRSEIWSRVESGKPIPAGLPASSGEQSWLRRLGTCPKVLLEMLNSRACRSAVMFNDVLSVPDCADLVERLGKCAFPFMCAHGRVSMVPIGVVGGDSGSGFKGAWGGDSAGEGAARAGFVGAWMRWKGDSSAQ